MTPEKKLEGNIKKAARWRASEKGRIYNSMYNESLKAKAAAAARYQRYRQQPERMAHRQERQRMRAAEHRAKLDVIKRASGCVDCGYNENSVALDFDHVRGSKVKNVGEMSNHTWKKVEAEMAKCEIRCANCHRVKTHEGIST